MNNQRVLIFSLCFESSGVPFEWGKEVYLEDINNPKIHKIIGKYKKTDDLVIASIHWGGNWGYEIPSSYRSFARWLIDEAGVDIIHGHSSHHPRPVEIYKGHPIFYGCGDFINDYEGISGYEEFRDDLSLMYFIDCGLKPFRLTSLEMVCMQINKFRLKHASFDDVKWMMKTLNRESHPFSTQFRLTAKNEIALSL